MSKFQVIPAVDLLGGNVVRLYKGDYDQSTVYGNDPAQPIRAFIEAGAELVHVVDLDAARQGDRSVNREAVRIIRAAAGDAVRLEIGGGIRDLSAVEEYRNAGMDRVIIGTAAVRDPEFTAQAVQRFGAEHVIVGVDALDGIVRVSGWEEKSSLTVRDFMRDLEERRGVQEIIFTDIDRDGALTGPPLGALRELLENSGLRIVASGGVATLDDVRSLLDLRRAAGDSRLVGVISGKAIYEGKLDLAAAVHLASAG